MSDRRALSTFAVEPIASARKARLRHINGSTQGYRRVRRGKEFSYVDANGKTIHDQATLNRIRSLVIPPAWTNVWICTDPEAHLQATGRDARGRKQYRYHSRWREVRDSGKFEQAIEFAEALPRIRRRVARDLSRPGLGREKVLAAVVRLLEVTLIRVGNDEYARQNGSYGLTTLRDRHVNLRGRRIHFAFRGKSGVDQQIDLRDPRLARIVRRCRDLPGEELFQYLDEKGTVHDVTSGDVNEYLREISGQNITAKCFRVWGATVLAAAALRQWAGFSSERQANRHIIAAVDLAAKTLGNTRAVCRKSYVHPRIFEAYLDGSLTQHFQTNLVVAGLLNGSIRRHELAVLDLLRRHRSRRRRAA